MANSETTQLVESLAAEIGEKVYIDVAKWHLYLSDAHLHVTLAERLFPLLDEAAIDEGRVGQVLREISVKLGGGRREIPLLELLPAACETDLLEILQEFREKM